MTTSLIVVGGLVAALNVGTLPSRCEIMQHFGAAQACTPSGGAFFSHHHDLIVCEAQHINNPPSIKHAVDSCKFHQNKNAKNSAKTKRTRTFGCLEMKLVNQFVLLITE